MQALIRARRKKRKKPGPKKEPRLKCDLCNEEEMASNVTEVEIIRSVRWEIAHPKEKEEVSLCLCRKCEKSYVKPMLRWRRKMIERAE